MIDPVQPFRHELALPGISFSAWRWSPAGDAMPSGRRVVILHGVTANALAFSAVARALAADGWTVDALDLPGHGGTRWTDAAGQPLADQESVGRSAYDLARVGGLVAAAMRALRGLPTGGARPATMTGAAVLSALSPPPAVIGHSWGAGVAVMAIDAGAAAAQLVLEDPPFLTAERAAELADGFRTEIKPELEEARAVVRSWGGGWSGEDAEARARALVDASPLAVDAITRGAPWDPVGLMAEWRARHPDLRVDVIAGDATAGGLVPPRVLRMLRVALGEERVHEMGGLGHSPHRDDPGRFLAVLRGVLA